MQSDEYAPLNTFPRAGKVTCLEELYETLRKQEMGGRLVGGGFN